MTRLRWVRFLLAGAIGGLIAVLIDSDTDPAPWFIFVLVFAAYVLAWTVREADQ